MNETASAPTSQSPQAAQAAPAAQSAQAVQPTGRPPANPIGWLRGEIDRLFDDFSFLRPTRSAFNFPMELDALRPVTDLVDEGTAYRLSVELPGLKQEDIDVEFRDGTLSISGEKKEETESKEGGCLISERRYGSVRRQLALPADVDPNGISAELKDGVLKLSLKKDQAAAAKSRRIEIR